MYKRSLLSKCFITLLGLFIFACKKPEAVKPSDSNVNIAASNHIVFITNEGNYGWGNASLSVFNADNNTIDNNAYKENTGQNIGDVFQSITLYNNKIYMVVNNSGKIEVANAEYLSHTATISGFTSPRYIQVVSSSKAYVTDLYANKLWIVNLNTNKISGSISLPGWSEQMAFYNNKLYVADENSNYLYIVNPQSDDISDSVLVNYGPAELQFDNNHNLWVLSNGDTTNQLSPALQKINLTNKQILKTYHFAMSAWPFRLCYDKNQDRFYYLNNGNVYDLDNGESALPTQAVINGNGRALYGLNVDNSNSDIYLTDAVDYVQRGWIYRYNSSFQKIDSAQAGIIPSSFTFKN